MENETIYLYEDGRITIAHPLRVDKDDVQDDHPERLQKVPYKCIISPDYHAHKTGTRNTVVEPELGRHKL